MHSNPSPFDDDTEYRIEKSGTPPTVDGYAAEEPKYLICECCGARVQLTDGPSAGIDDLPHAPACPQRFARSEWWRDQLLG
jgi:hypothetical protein